jgi:phosphatidylglycerophosphate synthase
MSRARVKAVFEPIALAMGRAGLTPDALTVIGFAITVVGAVLVSQGLWLAGGIVVFIGGVFDMFDGTLARATGQVSRLGAFMDSVFDRWGEAIVYLGIIAGLVWADQSTAAILGAAAMGAAFMVSYTRAKSEGLGFTTGTGMAAVGSWRRGRCASSSSRSGSSSPDRARSTSFHRPARSASSRASSRAGSPSRLPSHSSRILATVTTIQRIVHVTSRQ